MPTWVFDSVVVVTDRRVLDKQLQNTIKQFSEVKNIIAHATSSQELKTSLESGKKIIITTIQKFPHIVDGISDLSDKRFAVIIDEAHSSQSGSAADNLNQSLGSDEDEVQDKIIKAMKDRKMCSNASYFAFTATPKNATLERFGEKTAEGKFIPFHLYSMKQAIEEGFILDVLTNYTTYKSYYEIEKSILENPLFDSVKAQKKLRAYVEAHKETIAVKADIMVSHFLEQVVGPKKLKGQAKGMVVTRNIETAIHYFHAVRDALKGQPFKAMIAFSGKKKVDGVEYTEDIINGFPAKDIEAKFDSNEYRLLVVANKYLTGFDQPKLCTMYVDKKLQGVLAVQALSRLNRCSHALNKRKEDTFVLDFFNSTADIKEAFDPFYTSTSLSKATDVNVLHDLKEKLDEVGVYDLDDVEKFCTLFFSNAEAEELSAIIDVCADERFAHELELDDKEKADFKIKAKQFVKIYAQLACIMPFDIVEWEKLHWFLKFLIPKLKIKDTGGDELDALLESVDLSTYGLERVKLKTSIGLDDSPSELDPQNPNLRGVGPGGPEDPLDEIITAFNQRWFSGWEATPEQQRIKFINIAQHVISNPNYQTQVVDNQDEQNSRIALENLISKAVSHERRKELDLYKHYAQDPEFKRAFDSSIMRILSSQDISRVFFETTAS